jgi:CRP/FNR family transcriptional regulator, polysaccharide utilization system transcription regulator
MPVSKEDLAVKSCTTHEYDGSCFELLNDEENQLMEKNSVSIIFKKGETLCKQGAPAAHIFYLTEGLVKVYREGFHKNLILTITPSGSLLGLPAIFEGNNKYPYSITTYINSTIKMVDIVIFKQLLRQNAQFAFRIINLLNESTAQTYGRFFSLTQKQLHGRLADILLCLSTKIFKNDSFDLPLSRADLGDLTGMSTESVIRLIKEFKDDQLLEMNGKRMKLLDLGRLQRISDLG